MLPVQIAGLGSYLPARRVLNAELEDQLGITPGWIERVTGVCERRYAGPDDTVVTMATAAAQEALAQAGRTVADVDAIISASTTPYQLIPCTAAFVQAALGAPEGGSACWDMNATCLSFMVALYNAAHLVSAGAYRTVLIVSSEINRRTLNPTQRESTVLFGDAAAAAVLTRTPPGAESAVWHAEFATYSSGADLAQCRGGGSRHHPNDPATTPEMNLFDMQGPRLFKFGARLVGPMMTRVLDRLEWPREEIDQVVPHQASGHAVALLTTALGFRPDQVFLNLPQRGNCIAASIPLALTEAVAAGRIQRGSRVLLAGTGAGVTLGGLGLTY